MRTSLWIALTSIVIFLVAGGLIIFGPWFRPKPIGDIAPEIPEAKQREKVPVPKVVFTDVTAAAGIKFTHQNGAFGSKLLPETMGSGVGVLDFDNDGRQDVLFINSQPWPGEAGGKPPPTMTLYRNKGDGAFEDVTEKMGLALPLYGQGVTCGDFDNDGWIDVFVSAIGGNKLFRNDGGKRFVDVTSEASVGGPDQWPGHLSREDFLKLDKPIRWPSSATFFDYDGDGRLDLFVCHYVTWSPKIDLDNKFTIEGVGRAYGPPTFFEGAQCTLYRNLDGKKFEDVTKTAGIEVVEPEGIGPRARLRSVAKSLGVIVCDPDEDGWPDLVVANDTVRNFFFHNEPGPGGTRKFVEQGLQVGMAYAEGGARGGMGIDWGEYRGGNCAVIIANFADEPTTFLGQERPKKLSFSDAAQAVGVSGPSRAALKFGTFFVDYDLDGRLDIITANGHLEPEIEKVRKGQTFAQPAQIFWNTGQARAGCFESTAPRDVGDDVFKPLVGRGSAFLDFDGDGDPDILLTSNGGPARLLRNDSALKNHWIRLSLEGDGRRSNRSAIGAMVTVEAGGKTIRRFVTAGRGYLSQSELPITIGLEKTEAVDKITIQWPGREAGPATVIEKPAIDRTHIIKQDTSKP